MGKAPGRPRQFNETEVKEAILQTFWKKGYAAASLDDISEASGLVRPSLYGAFGSKADMYLMSIDTFLDHLGAARVALIGGRTVQEALERFYARVLDVYLGNKTTEQLGCFLVGTALAEAPDNSQIRTALRERLERLTETLKTTFEKKAPHAKAGDIRFAAEQAAATMHSLGVRARAGESRKSLHAFARRSALLIGGMLEANPKTFSEKV